VAYIRGSTYIWSDGEHLHLWAEDGLDGWQSMEQFSGKPNASGVQIAEALVDQFAVMRFAELVKAGRVKSVMEVALAHGNFGGAALAELAPLLVKVADAA
jgi:hypothetical protein